MSKRRLLDALLKHRLQATIFLRIYTPANMCGVTIGEYAFVGAGAVINRDIKPYALMVGVPAKQIGWITQYGERLGLPVTGDGEARCPATGKRYVLTGDAVSCMEE